MLSDWWTGSVKNGMNFYSILQIGLWTASMEGGGWASLESSLGN